MNANAPARRKPGPPKGTPAKGHRPKTPAATLEQAVFHARWQLFAAGVRPQIRAMMAALGVSRDVFSRRMKAGGAGFTAAQLEAGNALLDRVSPARWPAPTDLDEASAAR